MFIIKKQRALPRLPVLFVICMLLLGCAAPTTPPPAPTATPQPVADPTSTPAPTATPAPTETLVPTATPAPPTETPTPEPAVGAFNDNIAYAGTKNQKQTLAVHLPQDGQGPWPVVLVFHAGGFVEGSRTTVYDVSDYLADHGIAAISVSYRLKLAYPKAVNDAFCALAWTFSQAETYNFDTSSVVVMGFSAGADLSALLALIEDRSSYLADCPHGLSDDVQVAGVVGFAGTYNELTAEQYSDPDLTEATSAYLQPSRAGWEERATAASAVTYIHPTDIQFLLFHGEIDYYISKQTTMNFRDALEAQNIAVDYIELPGVDHVDLSDWRKDSSDANYHQTPERIQMDKVVAFVEGLD